MNGINLKYYRKQAGMSQIDLAKICGYSREIIAKIETNNRNTSIEEAQTFAKALNISVDDLTDDKKTKENIDKSIAENVYTFNQNKEKRVVELLNNVIEVMEKDWCERSATNSLLEELVESTNKIAQAIQMHSLFGGNL